MPVTILTGFLGSGKTSLLRRLLGDPRMAKTAVIINEFGDVGLDHLLLGKINDSTFLLESGCLCCTLRSDFADALKDIARRSRLGELPVVDRVVVETTGVADPLPMIRMLLTDETLAAHYRLQGVLTTVDCSLAEPQESRRQERQRQIALADRLVLTKLDLSDEGADIAIRSALYAVNSQADVIDGRDIGAVIAAIFDTTEQPAARIKSSDTPTTSQTCAPGCSVGHDEGGHDHDHHPDITSLCIEADQPIAWFDLLMFLRELARAYSLRLLRVKGLVDVAESPRPIVIHGVQHFLYPETYLDAWPDGERRSRIVIIVEHGEPEVIRALFAKHVNTVTVL